MHPDVQALLDRYGLTGDINRPCERVLIWGAALDRILRKPTPSLDALIDAVLARDARRCFFMLEGLFRLYERRYAEPAEEILARMKRMEDLIGDLDYEIEIAEAVRDRAVPPAALAYLDQRVLKARKRLAKALKKGWTADRKGRVPAIAELLASVIALPWDDVETDVAFLRQEIARRLDELESAELDMEKLEKGLHELRRELRWFPIYLTALDGIAVLDSHLNPIPEYEPLLDDSAAESQYGRLPSSNREPAPFRISRSAFVANTKYIAELGDLKDTGQRIAALVRALRRSGSVAGKKKARRRALEVFGMTAEKAERVHERSAAIYAEIRRCGLLSALRDEVLPGGKAVA